MSATLGDMTYLFLFSPPLPSQILFYTQAAKRSCSQVFDMASPTESPLAA